MFIIPNSTLKKCWCARGISFSSVWRGGITKSFYKTSIQGWEEPSVHKKFPSKRRWNGTPTTSKDARKKALSKKDTSATIANRKKLAKADFVREKPQASDWIVSGKRIWMVNQLNHHQKDKPLYYTYIIIHPYLIYLWYRKCVFFEDFSPFLDWEIYIPHPWFKRALPISLDKKEEVLSWHLVGSWHPWFLTRNPLTAMGHLEKIWLLWPLPVKMGQGTDD